MKEGWKVKKLGEVCEKIFAGGDKPQVFSEEATSILKVPVYANGVQNDGLCGFTDKCVVEKECVTVSARGTIGFCCIRTIPFVPIVRLITLIPSQSIDLKFLYYALRCLKIENNGTSIPQLTVPMLKGYSIPLPPLPEQERIVSILDAEFAKIDAVKAGAEKSLQHAKDLFQAALKKELTPKEGWETKKLGEVAEIVGGSTPKTNESSFWDGEFCWVTPAELGNNKYISSTNRMITDAGVKNAHLQLLPIGTVLLSSRAPIGKLAITKVAMYCNQGFKNLVCSDKLYNEFAYWFLCYSKDYLNSLGTGATFKEISKRVVEKVEIPLPPLPEQEQIVARLDTLNTHCKALQANYERTIALCDDMKQALLRKAFNGEL